MRSDPPNGSASLSETKVDAYLAAGAPLAAYTAGHFVKSYPKGIRQDSSNMQPLPSWLCGVQSVAMNVQTAGEDMDLVTGMFSVNGRCGYVLKPQLLLDGLGVREECERRPFTELHLHVICGQYLPKAEPGRDIIDPYVAVEVFGMPGDDYKCKTNTVYDNGEWAAGDGILLPASATCSITEHSGECHGRFYRTCLAFVSVTV